MVTPDLRQLRYFVAVAEELHFGRAAERIGIAQPPLTQQIQKLEAMLGCQLFVRGRKTVLTGPGMVLLEEARRILGQVERAMDATRRASLGETGQLTIGVPPNSAARVWLPPAWCNTVSISGFSAQQITMSYIPHDGSSPSRSLK